tara:strand:- start:3251 stop:4903 length:1653 start_codon:yes stop_codon:yes gene_type:complete
VNGAKFVRIVLAQGNFLVGDIEANTAKIITFCREAVARLDATLVVFPELALTGYPPEDLLLRPSLNSRIQDALTALAVDVTVPVVLGYPAIRNGRRVNVAGYLRPGCSPQEYFKQCLPNYRVFDEVRYFHAGDSACVIECDGIKLGLTICEDIWHAEPARMAAQAGAQLLVNLNASPYRRDKHAERIEQLATRAADTGLPILYCNMVGGQDELVFDGASMAVNAQGEVVVQGCSFNEALVPVDVALTPNGAGAQVVQLRGERLPVPENEEAVYQALVLAVRDYVSKNGFSGALLGLSGGIDSALTLAIAVDALGAEKVEAVMMPYRYTAAMSLEDAEAEARNLNVAYRVLPIAPAFEGFMETLTDAFAGTETGVTEQNLQARCRGTLLMALSNKMGSLVLTTGNKSEVAVGYSTLYGDMAGGFDVLKDVPKTWVYRLCVYRNQAAGYALIPQRVIDRPPSAELAPDQVDQDSLPDYDELDAILELYVEQDYSAEAVIRAGFNRETVYRIVRLVDRNEYKRRQAAVGPRVSRRAFGKDRRYPITNGWRPGD